MAAAVRALHADLGWLVARLNGFAAEGLPPEKAWQRLKVRELPGTRAGMSAVSSMIRAVRLVAEQRIDQRRVFLGVALGEIALKLARKEIQPREAQRLARNLLGADWVGAFGAVERARSERRKFAAAYEALAHDADVFPVADTRSGLRGELAKLYSELSATRDRILSRTKSV